MKFKYESLFLYVEHHERIQLSQGPEFFINTMDSKRYEEDTSERKYISKFFIPIHRI